MSSNVLVEADHFFGYGIPPEEVRSRYAEELTPSQNAALKMTFALRSASQIVDNTLIGWMAKQNLSPGKFQVLAALWLSKRDLRQKDLVRMLGVSRPTVSALVDALEKTKHVFRSPCPDDKRQTVVRLTAVGARVTLQAIRSNATRLREAMSSSSDDDLSSLAHELEILRDQLKPLS